MRVLCVDPGEKRLGIAVSDETGTIARPLAVIKHVSRLVDAATIAEVAAGQGARAIVVGAALDTDDQPTPQSRRSENLAAAIRNQTEIPVLLWDESGSTQQARQSRIAMGASRRKRSGHLDDLAATVILQDYLDSNARSQELRQGGENSPA